MVKTGMKPTEETPDQQMNKIIEKREHRSDFVKKKRKNYAEKSGRILEKKKKRKFQAESNV